MKNVYSLTEQIEAAKKEVESWPESVKKATEFCHSDSSSETERKKEFTSSARDRQQNTQHVVNT